MTAPTHTIVSTAFIAIGNIITGRPPDLLTISIAALASLMPDLDMPRSQVARICPPLSRWLYQNVGHRTLTHGIFGWLIAAGFFYPLSLIPIDANLYGAAILGYISHSLVDMLNLEGIRLLYPFAPNYCFVLPANADMRIKAGSEKEKTVRIVSAVICALLLGLNLMGERTLFRNFLGTPEAIARDYAHQMKLGYRSIVRISGVWTQGQNRVEGIFDVIGSTDMGLFVRAPENPAHVYQVGGSFSAISHVRVKVIQRIRAEQRVVKVKFNRERWRSELINQYPNGIISGVITTRALPPKFGIDEFTTVMRNGERWVITHAPIHLIHQVLGNSEAKLTGVIQIRYWKERGRAENRSHS